jgi:ATP-dependent DNA helicase UvrD/PcrA
VSRTKKAGAAPEKPRRIRTIPQAIAQTKPTTISAFAVGDRVSHPLFGDGTVRAIEGPKLSIAFDTQGDKAIIDSYVKRQKR